jgi:hypothetical protein
LTETGDPLPADMTWNFEDGRLTVKSATEVEADCLTVR